MRKILAGLALALVAGCGPVRTADVGGRDAAPLARDREDVELDWGFATTDRSARPASKPVPAEKDKGAETATRK